MEQQLKYRDQEDGNPMFKRWFRKRNTTPKQIEQIVDERLLLVTLKGRTIERTVMTSIGSSILQLAEQNKVDWSSNCRRGTCARCRSKIIEGAEYLSVPNEAEQARLEPEEIEAGFRLGCQTIVEKEGKIVVRHAPYF